MPEGDSIHRLAAKLRPKLLNQQVSAFEAHDIPDAIAQTVVGHQIVSVEARGKNLLVQFDDERTLHIHLRMLGRVRIERPRSTFWKPRTFGHQLRLVVNGSVIVGDRIPVLRLLRPGAVKSAPDLAGLGPDLLAKEVDVAEAVRRLRALGKRPLGEAVMIQRALAGIGNIYKSETLFLERRHPLRPVSELDVDALTSLVTRASKLLAANLGSGPRVTRVALTGGRFWVYGRRDKPCFRCGTPISMIRQGAPPGRSTYYCESCQS